MADPISLAASVIAVTGACTASIKLIMRVTGAIRDAPEELVRISNEVADLAVILLQVQERGATVENSLSRARVQPDNDVRSLLTVQLERAQACLFDIENLTRNCSKVSAKGDIVLDRIGWYRKRKTVDRLQRCLKVSRKNIHTLLDIDMT